MNYNFDEVLDMPYAKVYLLNKAMKVYHGDAEVTYHLAPEDLKAIELVENLPDDVNKMFDDALEGAEPVLL